MLPPETDTTAGCGVREAVPGVGGTGDTGPAAGTPGSAVEWGVGEGWEEAAGEAGEVAEAGEAGETGGESGEDGESVADGASGLGWLGGGAVTHNVSIFFRGPARAHRAAAPAHLPSRHAPTRRGASEVVRGEFIDVGDARLYYYAAGTRGAGEPVLLVHGFPTSSYLWTRVVPLIPAGHRVIVPDLLGFGRSDPSAQRGAAADITVAGHAARLGTFLDVLGIERVCAAGQGCGAAILLEVLATQPSRLTRLCLVDAVTAYSWPDRTATLARLALPVLALLPPPILLRILRRYLARGYRAPATFTHSAQHYLRPFIGPPNAGADGRRMLLQHLRALGTRPRAMAPVWTTDPMAAVPPTAIVWGADDPLLPVALGRRLQAQFPGATLDVVAGGHYSPEESPEQVGEVIRALLERPDPVDTPSPSPAPPPGPRA